MESFWSINVAAKHGRDWEGKDKYAHFFKVDIKGHQVSEAQAVFDELKERFPEPDFKITVTRWEVTGSHVNW